MLPVGVPLASSRKRMPILDIACLTDDGATVLACTLPASSTVPSVHSFTPLIR